MPGDEESEYQGELDADESSLLVFVDFSEGARRALIYAAELAADLGAPLYVVHVIHDPEDTPGYYQRKQKKLRKTLARMEDAAREMMASFIDEARAACRAPEVLAAAQTALPVGVPLPRMIEITERLAPRLVIVGSHGRTNLSDLLVGSKTAQFVRVSPRPVAVIKG